VTVSARVRVEQLRKAPPSLELSGSNNFIQAFNDVREFFWIYCADLFANSFG